MPDIEQIDWRRALKYYEFYSLGSIWSRWSRVLVRLGGCLIKPALSIPQVPTGSVLCIRSLKRDDYDVEWSLVCASVPEPKAIVQIAWRRGLGCGLISRLRFFPKALRVTKFYGIGCRRLLAFVTALYCIEALSVFSKCKPSNALFFAEMQAVENVLCQYYQSIGVPTASLQHGLYIDYGEQPTVNRLNYESSCADTFLAWGRETAELIQRYNKNVEVAVCGAPHLTDVIEESETEPEVVYVVFDAEINLNENRELLKVGKTLALKRSCSVMVCPHPRNRLENYDVDGCEMLVAEEGYRRKGIVLGHTTTQLINLARKGKHVYKLRSIQPCNQYIPEDVQFESEDELINKLSIGGYPEGWANTHIAYTGSDSTCRYRKFFGCWVKS